MNRVALSLVAFIAGAFVFTLDHAQAQSVPIGVIPIPASILTHAPSSISTGAPSSISTGSLGASVGLPPSIPTGAPSSVQTGAPNSISLTNLLSGGAP